MFCNLIKFIIIIFIFLNFDNNTAFSNIQNNNEPTKIKAEIINVIRNSGEIEFTNNAIIENSDTSILADKIIVFYNEKTKNSKASLKEAKATGNVKVFNEEFVATGDNGFYKPQDESFIITDNVIFNDGTSIANGEKFIYNLATKKGLLIGDKNKLDGIKNNRIMIIINEVNQQ